MKTFLLVATMLLCFTAITVEKAHAQIVSTHKPVAAKDTLTDADTTTISIPVDNISRSVELYSQVISGTPTTSKFYLEGTVDGTNYDRLDSLPMTTTGVVYKVILLKLNGDFKYKTYRGYCLSAGTTSWAPRVYLHRRSN